MIVLDTGSSDDTVAIAERHGATVHRFAWCDDFAAARNAALDRSDADWNLILDADEWLDTGAETLGSSMLPPASASPARFVGCVRLIATRIDAARRLGSIFAAAAAAELTIAEAGVAPLAADGLTPMTPRFLAERLLASYPGAA